MTSHSAHRQSGGHDRRGQLRRKLGFGLEREGLWYSAPKAQPRLGGILYLGTRQIHLPIGQGPRVTDLSEKGAGWTAVLLAQFPRVLALHSYRLVLLLGRVAAVHDMPALCLPQSLFHLAPVSHQKRRVLPSSLTNVYLRGRNRIGVCSPLMQDQVLQRLGRSVGQQPLQKK